MGFTGLAALLIARVRLSLPRASGNLHRIAQKSSSTMVALYHDREEIKWKSIYPSVRTPLPFFDDDDEDDEDDGSRCCRATSRASAPRARRIMAIAFACISLSDICPPPGP